MGQEFSYPRIFPDRETTENMLLHFLVKSLNEAFQVPAAVDKVLPTFTSTLRLRMAELVVARADIATVQQELLALTGTVTTNNETVLAAIADLQTQISTPDLQAIYDALDDKLNRYLEFTTFPHTLPVATDNLLLENDTEKYYASVSELLGDRQVLVNPATEDNLLSMDTNGQAKDAGVHVYTGDFSVVGDDAVPTTQSVHGFVNTKQNLNEKGQVDGYASLGPDGKVPGSQLPAVMGSALGALTDVDVVNPSINDHLSYDGTTWSNTSLTPSSVGLAQVTNDAQMKRVREYAAAFPVKMAQPGDNLLLEDGSEKYTITVADFTASFQRAVGGAQEDNLASFDANGNVQDSGVCVSIDNTLSPMTDSKVPSQKAVYEYIQNRSFSGIKYVHRVSVNNLDAIYDNGTNGVGAMLTSNTNMELDVDGPVSNNLRILVAGQTDKTQNGIYDVIDSGSVSTPYILHRSLDTNTPESYPTGLLFIAFDGDMYMNTLWYLAYVINDIGVDEVDIRILCSIGLRAENNLSELTATSAVVRGNIGLGNVDNTGDLDKPVSTAQQTALDTKLDSPVATFTEQSTTPSTLPNTGELKVYAKTDDKLYTLDSTGNEIEIGVGGASSVAELTDVELTSLANNEVLRYDATANKWKNVDISGMGSGGEFIPIGTIIAFYGSSIPNGWLLCDGSTFNTTTYPELNSFLGSSVPDLRGYFLRGLDTTGTVDTDGVGRTIGSVQNYATAKPVTSMVSRVDGSGLHSASNPSDVGFFRLSKAGENVTNLGTDSSGGGSEPDIRNPVTGDAETRPKNIAVNYIIKAKLIGDPVLIGGLSYRGVWDASTNTPSISDGVGTNGYYYKVSVAGTTLIDGISDWYVGDWIVFNGTTWDKIDNTDNITSVNGHVGVVVLTKADIDLINVTDDAQLKRSPNDFNTFTQKMSVVNSDILLIEDSEDNGNKKYIEAASLPISSVTQTALDTKLDATDATFIEQSSTPSNPNPGELKLFAKNDDKLYTVDSLGNETEVGGGVSIIAALADVELTSLDNNNILQYNSTSMKWENVNPSSIAGGGEFVPIGTISAFYGTTIPNGWLLCSGSTFDGVVYPDLSNLLGSTTLPDLRGYFLRGLDSAGDNVLSEAGRTVGDLQQDEFKSHTHSLTRKSNPDTGAHDAGNANASTSSAVTTDRSDIGTFDTAFTGGVETRPKNIAVNYIIKAKLIGDPILVGGLAYQGLWNSDTNVPDISSLTLASGSYYKVSVAGTTLIDGISDWHVGDWVIFNGTTWDKIDNTDNITSVNGQVGIVNLTKADIDLGNVTDDAQLKRSPNDFNTFSQKMSVVNGDILVIEDSEDNGNKKYIEAASLPISSVTQTALDTKLDAQIATFIEQSTTPSTLPDTGELKVYVKTDDKLYKLDSSGNETEIGGGGSSSIATLTDVEFTSLSDNEIMQYDATTNKWKNVSSIGVGGEFIPIGTASAFYGTTIPNGWLLCDGSTFSNIIYPDLAAFLGSTTLPDLRGYFLRGLDSAGVNVASELGRTIGTLQQDEFKIHTHGVANAEVNVNITAGIKTINLGGVNGTDFANGTNGNAPTVFVANAGGDETRPKNVAVNYIIKAKLIGDPVLIGGLSYQGVWDAITNTPTITDGTGTNGYYYKVSVAGTTVIDGISDWQVGDWIIFNGTTWDKIDNTESVNSVNGYTGVVVLNKADVGLDQVDNTNDLDKPVSTLVQNALDDKVDSSLIGVASGVAPLDTSSKIDNMYIDQSISQHNDVVVDTPLNGDVLVYDSVTNKWINQVPSGGSGAWGGITGTLADQTDLQGALNLKIDSSDVGVASGVAPLNASSQIDNSYINQSTADLVDVNIVGPSSGELLVYDSGSNKWVNRMSSGNKQAVHVVSLVDLNSVYDNGTSGVGATLTSNTNDTITIDGIALVLNNRVLVNGQIDPLQNGIYYISDAGSVSTPAILTRSTDADEPSEMSVGFTVTVISGTSSAGSVWYQSHSITAIGTDAIVFNPINASSDKLQISANLSDLNDPAVARTNLELDNVTNDAQLKRVADFVSFPAASTLSDTDKFLIEQAGAKVFVEYKDLVVMPSNMEELNTVASSMLDLYEMFYNTQIQSTQSVHVLNETDIDNALLAELDNTVYMIDGPITISNPKVFTKPCSILNLTNNVLSFTSTGLLKFMNQAFLMLGAFEDTRTVVNADEALVEVDTSAVVICIAAQFTVLNKGVVCTNGNVILGGCTFLHNTAPVIDHEFITVYNHQNVIVSACSFESTAATTCIRQREYVPGNINGKLVVVSNQHTNQGTPFAKFVDLTSIESYADLNFAFYDHTFNAIESVIITAQQTLPLNKFSQLNITKNHNLNTSTDFKGILALESSATGLDTGTPTAYIIRGNQSNAASLTYTSMSSDAQSVEARYDPVAFTTLSQSLDFHSFTNIFERMGDSLIKLFNFLTVDKPVYALNASTGLLYSGTGSLYNPLQISPPELNTLPDVDLSTLSDNDVLSYNQTSSKWVNIALTGSSAGLTNVSNDAQVKRDIDYATFPTQAPVDGDLVLLEDGSIKYYSTVADLNAGNQKFITTPTDNNLVSMSATGQVKDAGVTVSVDSVFSAMSDSLLPTQKAIGDYVQSQMVFNTREAVVVVALTNFDSVYNNGTGGVGASLTATANGTTTCDDVILSLNDRVLINGQTAVFENGIYIVTDPGDGSNPTVLVRAADTDEASELSIGFTVTVIAGTVNVGTIWYQIKPVVTVGTDDILFTVVNIGAGKLQILNNLSELSATAQTVRTNIGLGNVDDTSDNDKVTSGPVSSALALKQDLTGKGAVNGYASLDGSGKVPTAQLPAIASALAGLTDIQISSIAPNDYLQYNSTLGKWVNAPLNISTYGSFDSDWIDAGPIVIGATTTAPTKGTIVHDKYRYRFDGPDCIVEYSYYQTSAGTDGSGSYLYSLPSGIEFDDNYVRYTGSYGAPNPGSVVGYGWVSNQNTPGGNMTPIIYNSTKFRCIVEVMYSSAGYNSSSYYQLSGSQHIFTITLRFRVKGRGPVQTLKLSDNGLTNGCITIRSNNRIFTWGNPAISLIVGIATNTIYTPIELTFNNGYIPSNITKFLTGTYQTAVVADGAAYVMGENAYGAKGNTTTTNVSYTKFTKVEDGSMAGKTITNMWTQTFYHLPDSGSVPKAAFMAKASDKTYHMWGHWFTGNGIDTTLVNSTPRVIPGFNGLDVTFELGCEDSTSTRFAYEVQSDGVTPLPTGGRLWALGVNNTGSLGLGNTVNATTWTQSTETGTNAVITDCVSVSIFRRYQVGSTTHIIRYDGGAYSAWFSGDNGAWLGGDGTNTNQNRFTRCKLNASTNLTNVKKLISNQHGTYALLYNNDLYGCGVNSDGNLGLGNTTVQSYFVLLSTNVEDVFINTDIYYACTYIRKTDKSMWSCGYNKDNRLGIGFINDVVYSSFNRMYINNSEWFISIRIIRGTLTTGFLNGGMYGITNKHRILFWGLLDEYGAQLAPGKTGSLVENPYIKTLGYN